MSSDEEAAIIGRMVIEHKDLTKRETVLSEEIRRIGEGLQRLGRDLSNTVGLYQIEGLHIGDTDCGLLDAKKLNDLLGELRTARTRILELRQSLDKI
jgi:hypothetical protein